MEPGQEDPARLEGAPGVSDAECYDFSVAFSFFRFAAIIHGIKRRVIRGPAASAQTKARRYLAETDPLAWAPAERASA